MRNNSSLDKSFKMYHIILAKDIFITCQLFYIYAYLRNCILLNKTSQGLYLSCHFQQDEYGHILFSWLILGFSAVPSSFLCLLHAACCFSTISRHFPLFQPYGLETQGSSSFLCDHCGIGEDSNHVCQLTIIRKRWKIVFSLFSLVILGGQINFATKLPSFKET